MNFLIAGTGSIGQRHLHNIRHLDDNVKFLFLRRGARQDQLSYEMDAKVVSSVEDAVSSGIDCAVIATPSALHTSLVESLIHHNIPMYIEKPVVTTVNDVAKVRYALEFNDYRKPTLVGCNLRFLSSLVKVRELLKSGVVGNIVRATLQVGQWLPDWRPQQDYTKSYSASSKLGGGVIMDLIHELDAARWLLGDFVDVRAFSSGCPSLEIQSEAVACIILKGPDTPLVSINMDYVSRKPVRNYEFVGDKGTIYWDLIAKKLIVRTSDGVTGVDCGSQGFDVGETYLTAMKAFIESVKHDTPLEQDIVQGLESVELALRIKEVVNQ
jgi:predicted dehydrogenase